VSITSTLKSSPLFHDLLEDEIELFLKGQEIHTWQPGDWAQRSQSPIEAFYIIIEGKAELMYNNWDREFLMQELKRGDHFGEVLFGNDQIHPYSVKAKTELTCLRIDFPVFKNLYAKTPEIYALFINNLLRIELNLKKQALGAIGRIKDEESVSIGFPLFNRERRVFKKEEKEAEETSDNQPKAENCSSVEYKDE